MINLSKRLSAIVDMVPQKALTQTVADIGTDHAFVPIKLLLDGKISRAIAMDINEGPLLRAREHIEEEGLTGLIEVRQSDGLKALGCGEAQGVLITGMGGELILSILDGSEAVRRSVDWWVFSPQSKPGLFRHGLEMRQLAITKEIMVKDDGKFYTIMLAVPGTMHYESEADYRYGDLLIKEASPVFCEFMRKEEERIDTALASLSGAEKEQARSRARALIEEKKEIETVYDRMQRSV